jgi:hypothetical protein
LNRLDFSKRRNENLLRISHRSGSSDIIERIHFDLIIFSQKEMGSKKHMADVVLHDMIKWIYFYFIIFSQKEMGSENHMADVVLPVTSNFDS